jgi:hypothetical protein
MSSFQHHGENRAPRRATAILMVAALFLASCASKTPQPENTPGQPLVNLEAMDNDTAYGEGLKAYWLGDYKRAAQVFEGLGNRTPDQNFNSKARYALACARLAAAGSQEEFNQALAQWLEWEKQSAATDCLADPRLLTPILKNYKISGASKEQRMLRPSDSDCLKRLQDKEKEVINLQKQIKALETIHREIQEKKKMTTQ